MTDDTPPAQAKGRVSPVSGPPGGLDRKYLESVRRVTMSERLRSIVDQLLAEQDEHEARFATR